MSKWWVLLLTYALLIGAYIVMFKVLFTHSRHYHYTSAWQNYITNETFENNLSRIDILEFSSKLTGYPFYNTVVCFECMKLWCCQWYWNFCCLWTVPQNSIYTREHYLGIVWRNKHNAVQYLYATIKILCDWYNKPYIIISLIHFFGLALFSFNETPYRLAKAKWEHHLCLSIPQGLYIPYLSNTKKEIVQLSIMCQVEKVFLGASAV